MTDKQAVEFIEKRVSSFEKEYGRTPNMILASKDVLDMVKNGNPCKIDTLESGYQQFNGIRIEVDNLQYHYVSVGFMD